MPPNPGRQGQPSPCPAAARVSPRKGFDERSSRRPLRGGGAACHSRMVRRASVPGRKKKRFLNSSFRNKFQALVGAAERPHAAIRDGRCGGHEGGRGRWCGAPGPAVSGHMACAGGRAVGRTRPRGAARQDQRSGARACGGISRRPGFPGFYKEHADGQKAKPCSAPKHLSRIPDGRSPLLLPAPRSSGFP